MVADSTDSSNAAVMISSDDPGAALNRQRSPSNRALSPFTTRSQTPDEPSAPLSPRLEIPEGGPIQTSYLISHEPSQLPPLPLSPRWDAHNSSNNFSLPKSKAALSVPSPSDSLRPPSDAATRPLLVTTTTGVPDVTTEQQPRTVTPPGSESEPRASTDTIQSQNFSRPRKPSLKQAALESSRPKPPPSPLPLSPPPESPREFALSGTNRSRGQSSAASSIHSTYTSLSAPVQSPGDAQDASRSSRLRHATAAPTPLPPSPATSGQAESLSLGYPRVLTPLTIADESRSSSRSQWSTAQGTWETERSSVVTKDSSAHSTSADPDVDANPEEPSLEDVMGMYERGFHDDSSPEDEDEPNPADDRKDTIMNKRNTRILEALDQPLPPPRAPGSGSGSTLAVPGAEPLVRDSTEIFRPEQPTSPLREYASSDDKPAEEPEKRDSAKSLHETGSTPLRQASNLTTFTTSSAPSSVGADLEDPESRDRYGFRKANQYVSREQYDAWNAGYTEYLERRRKKWIAFQKDNGLMTDQPIRFPPPGAKTKRFIRKGIPPDWRGAAWFYYAGGPAILAKHSGVYDDLLQKQPRSVDVEAIERDLHRTFPDNIKFKPASWATNANAEQGRDSQQTEMAAGSSAGSSEAADESKAEPAMISSLRRVLQAFAIYNPRIGYCQSLNFLAGLLLLFLETEEQSFWLLNVITRVYLPGTHETSLEGSKVDLGVLMAAIRETMPAVWAKIGDENEGDPNAPKPSRGGNSLRRTKSKRFRHMASKSSDRLPPITLCMTAWFMSCFIGTLPMETTLRVWDVFFYEGSKTLFRIALTIFKVGEAEVKAIADPMEMFSVVQAMPRRLIDANGLLDACFKRRNGFGHLSQDTIETQRRERRNKVHMERERQVGGGRGGEGTKALDAIGEEPKPRRKGTLFGRRAKKDV